MFPTNEIGEVFLVFLKFIFFIYFMIINHLRYHHALFALIFKRHVFADDFVEMFWIRLHLIFEIYIYRLAHFQVALVLQLASV